jgi:hypothetical protein
MSGQFADVGEAGEKRKFEDANGGDFDLQLAKEWAEVPRVGDLVQVANSPFIPFKRPMSIEGNEKMDEAERYASLALGTRETLCIFLPYLSSSAMLPPAFNKQQIPLLYMCFGKPICATILERVIQYTACRFSSDMFMDKQANKRRGVGLIIALVNPSKGLPLAQQRE